MKKCGIYIEGLGAERAIDKLVNAQIQVLAAQKPQKNAVVIWVDGKDRKKVFAILQTSCYNIKKVRVRGLLRLAQTCRRSAGLLAGAAFFFACTLFFQSRVLSIRVEGSGAYLSEEVKTVLRENGTRMFSAFPRDTAKLSASVMALPRVTYCSFSHAGGILTVDVEISDENAVTQSEPLCAPVAGVIERITVVRGTPLVSAGDSVQKDDVLVADYTESEAGRRQVVVIAEAIVSYAVRAQYALGEEAALRQAYLDYGELQNIQVTSTQEGTLVEGTARAGVSLNLQ